MYDYSFVRCAKPPASKRRVSIIAHPLAHDPVDSVQGQTLPLLITSLKNQVFVDFGLTKLKTSVLARVLVEPMH